MLVNNSIYSENTDNNIIEKIRFFKAYFYCKDNESRKETCPDRQLFEEESKSCKEYKDVYCGDRSVNDKDKDQCRTKPNGGLNILIFYKYRKLAFSFTEVYQNCAVNSSEIVHSIDLNDLFHKFDTSSIK